MKSIRIFRSLATALILVLLVITMQARPVRAQTVVCSPTGGSVGTTVIVSGTGYTGYVGTVYILFNQIHIQTAVVNSSLAFSTSFLVPTFATAGSAIISVQHTSSTYDITKQLAITVFTVTQTGIVASPVSGNVGDQISVTGTAFAASSSITLYWDNVAVSTATISTNAYGNFSYTGFVIPESTRGSHTIKAVDASINTATATFTTLQAVAVSPISGSVDSSVAVSGNGFRASRTATIKFAGSTVATAQTNSNGSLSANFTVPSKGSGTYEVKASDGVYEATINFIISASSSSDQATGYPGDEITISGSGFMADYTLTIYFGGSVLGTTPADSSGAFSTTLDIPYTSSGSYKITVSDGVNEVEFDFTVSLYMELDHPVGYVGMELTVSGIGFSGAVDIKYDGDLVTGADVGTEKTFEASFYVPASVYGSHLVTVSDGLNTMETNFIMESTLPLAPPMLEPEAGVKAKAEAHFDWEEVTDDSLPVTYILQIGSDANFSALILNKSGLTDSEYTLTKEERLISVKKETPYYWRVKAVDAASNESAWSDATPFYVGFTFSLPPWAAYTLISVGVVVLLGLSFWFGRRTAF